MKNLQFANDNGTTPTNTVAVDSSQPQATTTALSVKNIRQYTVPITADIQLSLTAYVKVYDSGFEEAAAKVQAQLDAGTVDAHTEMEDVYSGYTMSFEEVAEYFGGVCEIVESDIEVDEDECDPVDVLDAEVELLQTTIVWDFEMQTKLKAFLEALTGMEVSAA